MIWPHHRACAQNCKSASSICFLKAPQTWSLSGSVCSNIRDWRSETILEVWKSEWSFRKHSLQQWRKKWTLPISQSSSISHHIYIYSIWYHDIVLSSSSRNSINILHVIMEVWFRSFSFLFMGDGCRFQQLIFQPWSLVVTLVITFKQHLEETSNKSRTTGSEPNM